MVKYLFTLISFQGKTLGYVDYEYKRLRDAIARGGMLLWETDKCGRVLIESNNGFQMTLEWGTRRDC